MIELLSQAGVAQAHQKSFYKLLQPLSPVLTITPITARPSKTHLRSSFKIQTMNGATLKARCFATVFECNRMQSAIQLSKSKYLTEIIDHDEQVILERWVEGKSLKEIPMHIEHFQQCGNVLADIQCVTDDKLKAKNELERSQWIEWNFSVFKASEAFDSKELDRLKKYIDKHRTDNYEIGVIHGDFYPENLVIDESGIFMCVDNETMRIESLDYDLARTWSHWTMHPEQANAFLKGYELKRSTKTFQQNYMYWLLMALMDGAAFCLNHNIDTALPLVKSIKHLLLQIKNNHIKDIFNVMPQFQV